MLRYILLFFLVLILYRIIAPVVRGFLKLFQSSPREQKTVEKEPDYSELSPYEIEDAEYEEVQKGKD